jgi:beta-galactosidase
MSSPYMPVAGQENPHTWSDDDLSIEASDYVHINLRRSPHAPALPIISRHDPRVNKTHTFPTQTPDWSNLEVIHRNTLPPRASFYVYDTVKDALTRDVSRSKTLSLSGTWKFHLSKNPFEAPEDFFQPHYDTSKWGDIKVPGMWQLQGYGKGPQCVPCLQQSIKPLTT